MAQNEAILDYIKKHGGIMRLASRIHDIKKLGVNIVDEMVTANNGKRFKRYRLEVGA